MAQPRTALLVIDMQRVFEPMTTTALPNIKKLISRFQAASAPIVFTQHGHSKEELTTVPSPNQLVRKWGPDGSIAYGSEDWKLQDTMQEYIDAAGSNHWPRLVHKNTYDAFINTDLAQILEEAGIRRTVVCGVMTDCCWCVFSRLPFLIITSLVIAFQTNAELSETLSVTRRQEVHLIVGSRHGLLVMRVGVQTKHNTKPV